MNKIVAENSKPGVSPGVWDIVGAGDSNIEGFSTEISVNLGEAVHFKIKTDATAYRLDIYRMGYYGGNGARKIATVQPSVTLPQPQLIPPPDPITRLIDCGNWAISASWTVPADATSGIYFAKLVRQDGVAGVGHIFFIVRDDETHSELLFQTSDTTWQAYNEWGGFGLYTAPRAYKVSYNRPCITGKLDGEKGANWILNAEYPMVRWLERNGYDVSYFAGVDSDRFGTKILEHKVFLSLGHDEYWSKEQRSNVEAARNAGVHLAFFSGNEVYWKIRWENSTDGSETPYRTLVCYKETHEDKKIDPTPEWTGTWRDPRLSPPGDGGRPENELTGTFSKKVAGFSSSRISVPPEYTKHRFWRNTNVANVGSPLLTAGLLGYEWDEDPDNGFRPAGLMRLSSTMEDLVPCLQDYGTIYTPGTATHHLTLYRHSSGALVFSAGTVQWAWGLEEPLNIQGRTWGPIDPNIQQATLNLLADMGVQPTSPQPNLVAASASTDSTPPASLITFPVNGAILQPGQPIKITGTASDVGGQIGAIEISVNDGITWHPASSFENWEYSWTPTGNGPVTILSRAVDDSGNLESPSDGISVIVGQVSGAPILVVVNSSYLSNPFGDYLTEILRAEGLVCFEKIELGTLMSKVDPLAYMNPSKLVLLAETNLFPDQEQLMRSYVTGGGSLIAMRPDPVLAELFGLSFVDERLEQPGQPSQFFAFDTASGPGVGITSLSLQYHGHAHNYTLSGAIALANLWDDLNTPSIKPAVAIHNHDNGKAAAFTFDLAKSIVLMRQGNPEWKNSEGDAAQGVRKNPADFAQDTLNNTQFRPMDMFARVDGRIWFEPERLRIPQADEQQRFLANLILTMINQPIPRLWYLPAKHRALIVNTGDGEHYTPTEMSKPMTDAASHGGTFSTYLRREQICNDFNAGILVSKTIESDWRLAGHEIGVHVFASDPPGVDSKNVQTYLQLHRAYGDIISALQITYEHVARTARSHTIDWVGWVDMAKIEAEHGTRMDLNFYHYWEFAAITDPARFPQLKLPTDKTRAFGYFTGSGLAQRFSDEYGTILPIYQLLTEWPDEFFYGNGFDPLKVFDDVIAKMLLAANNGYYSSFVVNIHHGPYWSGLTEPWVHAMWNHAVAQGIPMWSAEKLLDFVESRNAASFNNMSWDGTKLTLDFKTPVGGQDLTVMVPDENLVSIEVDGTPVAFTNEEIKARSYALFTINATNAQVVATYGHAWIETTSADFTQGTSDSVQVLGIGNGSVALDGSMFVDSFTDPQNWESWPASGDLSQTAIWLPQNNIYVHDFNQNVATYHPAVLSAASSPTGNFSFLARQRIVQVSTGPGDIGVLGFIFGGQDPQNYFLIQYAQQGLGLKLYRRKMLSNFTLLGQINMPDPITGQWYDVRVNVVDGIFKVYIDGLLKLTATDAAYLPGRIGLLGYKGSRTEYKDIIVTSGGGTLAGVYTSKVFDATGAAHWGPMSWISEIPDGTVLAFGVRTGNSPVPDQGWTDFQPIPSSGTMIAANSRYIQYRVIFARTDQLISPILKQVRITYS